MQYCAPFLSDTFLESAIDSKQASLPSAAEGLLGKRTTAMLNFQ